MPTGRLTFPDGISAPAIQVPRLPGSPADTRGNNEGVGGGVSAPIVQPVIEPDYGALHATERYAGLSVEVAKANFIYPTNQGHRAAVDSRQSMMFDPRNNPARMQFQEGYTAPIQLFASSNTWQIAGQTSVGTRAKQPSTKFVSPFSSLPIPVRMPWDL
jgi:hypothetical protein